jgi:hypothetical protein
LNGLNFSSLDSAGSVEFGVLELFVEFVESLIVVGLVFLVFHFQAQHEVLAHFRVVLGGLDVFHEMCDLLVGLLDVCLKRFQVVFVHDLLLSQSVDLLLQLLNVAHGFIVPFIILNLIKQLRCRFVFEDFSFW